MRAFPLRSISIVGAGAFGWLAAATLKRVLGDSCSVRVLVLPDDNAINGGVASVPSLHRLFALLGVEETALMRATQATYRLGAAFVDWGASGERYFHGFGSFGAKLDAVPFQHHWLRLALRGECAAFEEFSMAAQAARLERFALPQADPRSVLSLFSYAWHFDLELLASALRQYALEHGATEVRGDVAAVELEPESGFIAALLLEHGSRLTDNFYVDCSGARGLLRTALGIELEDWSAWLPCDRLQWLRRDATQALPPYSQATADTQGYRFSMPLQHGTVLGQVYCSEFYDDDTSAAMLLAAAEGKAQGTPATRRLVRGRPREFWVRNCLLLPGDTLDPLESTSLHLAQTGITRFLAHLPARLPSPPDCGEYNRLTIEEYDRIRDLLVLHYHATRRDDSPFWKRCRSMPVPDSLAQKLALFADSGRITIGEEEHCGVDGWLAVLLGQGVQPRTYDPLAEATPLDVARTALAAMATQMRNCAAGLPPHREYIAQRGATAPRLPLRT